MASKSSAFFSGVIGTAVRIADLAAKGSIVAIAAADDPDFEYHLS